LASEFIFEYIYSNYDGDKKALDNDLVSPLNLATVPFPTNENIMYDARENLKARLKDIITQQRFILMENKSKILKTPFI